MQPDTTTAPAPKKTLGRRPRATSRAFLPLEQEPRTHVDTEAAAFYLTRSPQTLRAWASSEKGPIRPLRIPGRLGLLWSVADIKAVLGVGV